MSEFIDSFLPYNFVFLPCTGSCTSTPAGTP